MMGARVEVSNWRWMPSAASDVAHTSTPISFSLGPGDRVLLRGRSGAGKSTLLAALAGLNGGESNEPSDTHPGHIRTEGTIRIDDGSPWDRRGTVGLLLQDPFTQAVMPRVGDDVAFGLENIGVDPAEMPARIQTALESVGLDVPLDAATDRLSGGQRQRLALAGIVAMRPSLLILDEPTANLDTPGALMIRDAVSRLVREHGLTLIVVDHTPDFWAHVVQREVELVGPSRERAERPASEPVKRALEPRHAVTLVRATNLAVGYPRAAVARESLSFEVRAGRILVVTGPNGAGKSALALTLARLIPARGGSLEFSREATGGEGSSTRRPYVGLVFQTPEHQFIGSTVRADVGVGLTSSRLQRDARVDEMLNEFDLTHLAERSPFVLSGGEKRRLSVADIVAAVPPGKPSVLVFDEPTTGLDDIAWNELVVSLRSLASSGHGLVVNTHDVRLIEAVGDDRLELGS